MENTESKSFSKKNDDFDNLDTSILNSDSDDFDTLPEIPLSKGETNSRSRNLYLKNDTSDFSSYKWSIDRLSSTATLDDMNRKRRKFAVERLLYYDKGQLENQEEIGISNLVNENLGSEVLNLLRTNSVRSGTLQYHYYNPSLAEPEAYINLPKLSISEELKHQLLNCPVYIFEVVACSNLIPPSIISCVLVYRFFNSFYSPPRSTWLECLKTYLHSNIQSKRDSGLDVNFFYRQVCQKVGFNTQKRYQSVRSETISPKEVCSIVLNDSSDVNFFVQCCQLMYPICPQKLQSIIVQDVFRCLLDIKVGHSCRLSFMKFMELTITSEKPHFFYDLVRLSDQPPVWVSILSSLPSNSPRVVHFRTNLAIHWFLGTLPEPAFILSSICEQLDTLLDRCRNEDYTDLLFLTMTFSYTVAGLDLKRSENLSLILEKLRKLNLAIPGTTEHLLLSRCEVKDYIHRLYMVIYYENSDVYSELERTIEKDQGSVRKQNEPPKGNTARNTPKKSSTNRKGGKKKRRRNKSQG
ncbi:Smc5-6 complex non-SMC subunit Nse6 [Schizosaccharomyces cryophilus OY26]|uniref:Smc5-6 complex non-SMC subunit Nse6 n=1 Tax=Schizosaccharomyces cryophilus (strain OY26 / ATCC MYA-4695 / CBS 11777 / NBRC 106824 / NRRL Y48691) TaxID=653667 RepID=S9VVH5_SCHCR|nr:Smc5-6 complex non-SMC subunit Nse6 [Schizosaccharomyces cryophilus OY26]EPY50169.1 Smc5-6 complex non-SMC subunit Nse6 [Schizosaccharomyces cryophilus OY26]